MNRLKVGFASTLATRRMIRRIEAFRPDVIQLHNLHGYYLDWRVLFHLGIYGEMTAKEIGLRASMHKTKISRSVQRLAEKRFLQRTRDAADRRSEKLVLTAAGEAAYRDCGDW